MKNSAVGLSVLAVVSLPLTARADAILQGVLNMTGTVQVSLGSIVFEDDAFSINSPSNTQQGGFTTLAGTTGTIESITNPPTAVGPVDIPDFMTFGADPNITFKLTYLYAGTDGTAQCFIAPASGQQCTPNVPAQSPYNLDNTTSSSSTATFNIAGLEVDRTTGDTIPFVGIFSTQFPTDNYQTLLAAVDGGGTITTSFSASFATATVPEPGTWIEFMIGAVGIGLVYRRLGAAFRMWN
jgi:hypothetical protein